MTKDEEFMQEAIGEAKKGKGPKKFGSVVVKNDRIVARAHATVYEEKDPTKHAEVKAVSEAAKNLANRRLNGCIIYTTCEPCMMCVGAVLWARMDKVVYGMSRKEALELFNDSSHWHMNIEKLVPKGFEIKKGILKEACREVTI